MFRASRSEVHRSSGHNSERTYGCDGISPSHSEIVSDTGECTASCRHSETLRRGTHKVVQVIRGPGLLSEEARHRMMPGLFLAKRVLGPGRHCAFAALRGHTRCCYMNYSWGGSLLALQGLSRAWCLVDYCACGVPLELSKHSQHLCLLPCPRSYP
jgi:hypothetical protein